MDKRLKWRPLYWGVAVLLLLSGCATSRVPLPIRAGLDNQVPIDEVRIHPKRHLHAPVRWGGEIISLDNRKQETWVELLAYPLGNEGRPRLHRSNKGRFLGRFPGFLDPSIFKPGRELTVTGWAEGLITRPVGEYPYSYPLVNVQVYHLWPVRQRHQPWRYDPWYDPFYDPFYDPWYPYYRHPFYRRPYYPYPWW